MYTLLFQIHKASFYYQHLRQFAYYAHINCTWDNHPKQECKRIAKYFKKLTLTVISFPEFSGRLAKVMAAAAAAPEDIPT